MSIHLFSLFVALGLILSSVVAAPTTQPAALAPVLAAAVRLQTPAPTPALAEPARLLRHAGQRGYCASRRRR